MKKRNITIFFCIILFSPQLIAQKIHFSQFYAAPLVLSPSYTGLIGGSRAVFNYRDQWPSLPGTFTTFAFSYDQFFHRMKSGLGFSVLRDNAGSSNLNLTEVGLLYSYDIKVDRKWHVRPGIKFKYGQRAISKEKLVFNSQLNDEGEETDGQTGDHFGIKDKATYIDVDASIIAYHNRYWGGLTVAHLLRPNQSLTNDISRIPMKFTVFGGTMLPIKGNKRKRHEITESVTFSLLYQNQELNDQLDLGAYWHKAPFTLGLWVRGIPAFGKKLGGYPGLDAVIVLIGFELLEDLKFGYSYDYTLSKLSQSVTGGAHEVSLIFEFNKNVQWKKNQRKVTIPCPDF